MASSYLVKVLGLSLAFWSSRNSLKSWSIVLSGLRFFIGSSILKIVCAAIHLIQSDREDHALRPNRFHLFLRMPQPNLSRGMQYLVSGFARWRPCTSNHGG